jgi:signal transduction histidine kinase
MEGQLLLPATLPADRRQKRLALAVALLVPIPFIAIIPIGQIQLPRIDSYIPVVDTMILINDSITATLLLAHFSITRSPSLLALAAGFLFTAFLIVPHALTLPGAFAPNGLLDARLQTPAWLNEVWHLGLPTAVIAYALLKRTDGVKQLPRSTVRSAILATVAAVFATTWALLWLTTTGVEFLPAIMTDLFHSDAPWVFLPPVALSITAAALLLPQRHSLLDLWLLVVLEIWMFDALLFYKLTTRYTLLWYGGRAFATVAASLVLLFLLSQTTVLYGRLARSNMMLERERDNKLMNFEAIAAAISHEIKQPLTAIVGNGNAALALLGKSPPDIHETREALHDIVGDGHRAGEVIDGIRALFRKVDHTRQLIDMNGIVLEVLQSLRSELREHDVSARPQLESGLPLIEGNKNQLQQVIHNLVHNAVDALDSTVDRERLLQVSTDRRDRDTVVVTVQDTGPGIDPTRLDDVFDAFFTTKEHGTGLGLAICRVIAERHSGQLLASSDGKNGAIFQLVLPIESKGLESEQSNGSA